ncbi:amino acid efflux transporter [Micromonospora phaseoli]|uniref:Amino acid efflux transporter n=1 Tax=Micromonospora phaseoli TaxID=1144548 RepID=A0A1H6VNQ8_9ACTN|nr:amino acid permease [Micromonospora phaseoli]PZV93575.1 amino acid exporter (AAE family) [Micromonospora phaseoli]GIJ80206.1 amino acid permease [Micromonospora phaseoli]SEJ03387.1 amino acid efflux transporter [Micromonospora phaseoli]
MTQTHPTPVTGGRLTAAQGAALYVGAVLGTGVIALPALAAEAAGPASLLAWLLLVVVSAPLAATFAALGSRYPDAGGVSTYARMAFGPRAAAVVGWCFYFAVPPGASAAALFGGAYVEAALGGGTVTVAATAMLLMAAVTVTNHSGVQLAGRVQLALAGVLVTFLLLAVLLSLPHASVGNFEPFAPQGVTAIGPAAALLMWSFVGWEAITHLTGEFRRPARDLPRATAAAVVVVGVLYLAVAFATIAVLGSAAAESDAPLGELLAVALGGDARWLSAGAALLLTFGAMNAYYAGAAKLGAALGRDGALPGWLARGSVAGEVPRRSLAVTAILAFLALAAVVAAGLGTRPLVLVATGSFIAVYLIGVAAALRLLPRRSGAWYAAAATIGVVLLLLLMTGVYLIWPVVVTGAALLYLRLRGRIRS